MDALGTNYTQYNDLSGKISVDFHGSPGEDLEAYARGLEIDTQRYLPFGVEVYAIETEDMPREGGVNILAYDMQDNNNIVRFKNRDSLQGLLSKVWRLSITMTEEGYQDNANMQLRLHREIE
jgi:hypothetical protein